MKTTTRIGLALSVVIAAVLAANPSHAVGQRRGLPVALQQSPSGVYAIVYAQPFVLEKSWTHVWRAEQPVFDAGWLVVLDVDPTLVHPQQTYEPVLYAGDQTVERINHGFASGRVVAIVPCARNERGEPALDLSATPLWFGIPELPERVDAAAIAHEREAAVKRGVRPLHLPAVQRTLRLPSRDELDAHEGILVLDHAPDEQELGNYLLLPKSP